MCTVKKNMEGEPGNEATAGESVGKRLDMYGYIGV